jgi:hypothetical protein
MVLQVFADLSDHSSTLFVDNKTGVTFAAEIGFQVKEVILQ